MFAADARPAPTALHAAARTRLLDGGTVLDVGCGGGAASVPLAGAATLLVGVDPLPAMLAGFAAAATAAGVAHEEILGAWPDAASACPLADVVVCSHVVYNVAEIEPFLIGLADHARTLVVVELSDRHPSTPLAPLWRRFWDLERPSGPDAALFVEVVEGLGFRPQLWRRERAVAKAGLDESAYVAFVRRRLCLSADRDDEIAAALHEQAPAGAAPVSTAVTVAWEPVPPRPPP